jgi:hypothetical protein
MSVAYGTWPVYRHTLRPGQMFVPTRISIGTRWLFDDVYVVLDAKTEIGFWSGALAKLGDVAPGALVQVML